MSPAPPQARRCAIYTRVSTDHGLDQEFNSLDAQREACEAYVKSQRHEGWQLLPALYDDGGFSGGSLERPALQRLIEDVKAGSIDVVVVYKVDRLTRSLADFAKLVELFDAVSASFVSVTQAFNTTTSMGRLTLNVLLSFAQFEREVTGERIRDKIAASKKKGLWVGGVVPLGYRVEDKKLVVDKAEAATVCLIFERYAALGSMLALMAELDQRGIRTRRRQLATGRVIGGVPFTKGPLAYLLKNRTYLGEINHRDKSYPGPHVGIIDPTLFNAVQEKLVQGLAAYRTTRMASEALLMGRIVDDAGNTMTPCAAHKGARRYLYYVSRALIEGRPGNAGHIARIAAPKLEAVVVAAVRRSDGRTPNDLEDDRSLIVRRVERVEVGPHRITVVLVPRDDADKPRQLVIPWSPKGRSPQRDILRPAGAHGEPPELQRSDARATLLGGIARGRAWLAELIGDPDLDPDALANREGCTRRHVHRLLSLAFLAPDIVETALAGRLPHRCGISRLVDLPADWDRQRILLGLPARPDPIA